MRSKGKASHLSYQGHVLMENRHGLVVDARLTQADGYAERAAALEMLGELLDGPRVTLGADRGYDTRDFVESCRLLGVTPHVAQNTTNRASRIDARTTRHPGYRQSQRTRKRVEEVFGWMKTVGSDAQDPASRQEKGRLDLHLHSRRVQSGADAKPMRCVRLRSGKPVVGAGGGPARSCAGGQEARDEQSARPPSMFEHGAPTRPDLSQPSQDFFSALLGLNRAPCQQRASTLGPFRDSLGSGS